MSEDDRELLEALDRLGFVQHSSIKVEPFEDKAVFSIDTGFGISFAHRMTAEQLDIHIAQLVDVYAHIAPDGTAASDRLERSALARAVGFYFQLSHGDRVMPACYGRGPLATEDPALLDRLFTDEDVAAVAGRAMAERSGCQFVVRPRAI